jgi:DNA-directed RNA polymerase specialized sigma subunit
MGRIYHLSESRVKKTEDEAIGKLRKKMKHAP